MEVVYRRCCGIDVHKDSITACVLVNDTGKQREARKKEFVHIGVMCRKLKLWLYACKVEQVAMESTGVYWKPIWNVLEGHFPLLLANPVPHAEHSRPEEGPERQRMDQRPFSTRAAASQFRAPSACTGAERFDTYHQTDGRTEPGSQSDREDSGKRQPETRIGGQRHSGGHGPAHYRSDYGGPGAFRLAGG